MKLTDEQKDIKLEQMKIKKLIRRGHSYHCAARQTWGDGECECKLYGDVYQPYAWAGMTIEEAEGKKISNP